MARARNGGQPLLPNVYENCDTGQLPPGQLITNFPAEARGPLPQYSSVFETWEVSVADSLVHVVHNVSLRGAVSLLSPVGP
jgi:hypothetical protein